MTATTARPKGALAMALAAMVLAAAPASRAQPAPPSATDVAAAAAIAAEARKSAGQMGAARVVASHFADQLDSRHYPASPGDGLVAGAGMAGSVGGRLATYLKAVPDYRMDERVGHKGNVVTVTAFITGTYPTGGKFEDVSMAAYEVHGGKITRGDAVHTNPAASQKAFRGNDSRGTEDHQAALKLAEAMRAMKGDGLLAAPAHFAERIAVWSPDSLDTAQLFTRQMLSGATTGENGMMKKALRDYANTETITVRDNAVILDSKTTGKLANGEATWTDTHAELYVTGGVIVGLKVSHTPGARANLKKIFAGG